MRFKLGQIIIDIIRGKKGKKPKINDYMHTINILIHTNKSIARFGDGEISIILGNDIPYQEYNQELANKLIHLLKDIDKNILTGINYEYYYSKNIKNMLPAVKNFYINSVPYYREALSKFLNFNKRYCSAGFTQLYLTFEKYDFIQHYSKLKKIWNNKKILLVTCNELLQKIEFNIYNNASEINYLIIDSKNAFSKYEKYIKAIKQYNKDVIIIPMAGPTGKAFVYDLTKEGYRVLDLGHLMKDYDWYKKQHIRDKDNIYNFMDVD